MAWDYTLAFEEARCSAGSWAYERGGTVLLSPERLAYVQIQFNPEYTNPTEVLELRVRAPLPTRPTSRPSATRRSGC